MSDLDKSRSHFDYKWKINHWELDPEIVAEQAALLRRSMPELKVVRQQAQKDLTAAIADSVAPLGYEQVEAGLWVKSSPTAITYVELQKERRGFACHINVGVENPTASPVPSYLPGTLKRIGQFEGSVDAANRIDSLDYYELVADPEFIPFLMKLLQAKALPYLEEKSAPVIKRSKPTWMKWLSGN